MKISIIGMGKSGSAIAFSLLHSVKIDELVLSDKIKDLVNGEAIDLNHAKVALSPETKITVMEDIEQTKDSDIVIITAGKARMPGDNKKREDLFEVNKEIIKPICENIAKYSPNSYLIIVTNPSTQMGKVALEASGFPKERVIAMDNQLDTARLKYYISEETGLPLKEIKSYVRGEHGEKMEIVFKDNLTDIQKQKIKKQTIEAGRNIIELKGYTCWGIASQVTEVVKKLIKTF